MSIHVYVHILQEIYICMKICVMMYSVTPTISRTCTDPRQILEHEYWRTQDGVFESSRLRSTEATVPIESIPTPTLQMETKHILTHQKLKMRTRATKGCRQCLRIGLLLTVLVLVGLHSVAAAATGMVTATDSAAVSTGDTAGSAIGAADGTGSESQSRSPSGWTTTSFPLAGSPTCRSNSNNRLCDPDGILIHVERQRVLKRIEELEQEQRNHVACPGSHASIQVQLAVALVHRMDLMGDSNYYYTPTSSGSSLNPEEKAAEAFAVHLHNLWGVGSTTECGGTGILVFVSILDRAFYISKGKALESLLTNKRIDRIMDTVKPELRDEDYARALLMLVDELDKYLTMGPPSQQELRNDMLENLIPLSLFALIVGIMGFKGRRDHLQARTYAQVQTQLSQLDRDRAEALQGRYQCTSCPICLENFQPPPEEGSAPTKGSDGLPLKLLRCGHVFDDTCWSEWVSLGTGNVRRCPVCQQDVGGGSSTTTDDGLPPPPVVGDDNRIFRQFHRERNFRLLRLGMRYPQYIHHDQIQRWTDTMYEGSLARDPTFVRHDPRHHFSTANRRGSSTNGMGSSTSFGGGSSGGGRGGSW